MKSTFHKNDYDLIRKVIVIILVKKFK